MTRGTACILLLLIGATGCDDAPATAPPVAEPLDRHEALVVIVVTDSEGDTVPWSRVVVAEACLVENESKCPTVRTRGSNYGDGELLAWFESELEGPREVRMELTVLPPLGKGYVLGSETIEGLIVHFDPPPAAEPTRAQVVLPPNMVDSRQPVRVHESDHVRSRLRADAERFYLSERVNGTAAIDPVTGDWLWIGGGWTPDEGAGPEYALLGDRVVIAGPVIPGPSFAGLIAVKASDGELMWIREAVPHQTVAVSPPDGLYAVEDGIVMAFDPHSGGTRWSRDLIGKGQADLAASAELVCTEMLAFVECWDAVTGDRAWTRNTEVGSWLAIAGNVVILGSQAGWTAMDATNGDIVWEAAIDPGPPPILSPDSGQAFACAGIACFSIRVDNGALLWRTGLQKSVGRPVADGGSLFVRVGEGSASSIHVLDTASGAIRERILPDPFDHGFCGDPAVTADYLAILGCGSFYTFLRID